MQDSECHLWALFFILMHTPDRIQIQLFFFSITCIHFLDQNFILHLYLLLQVKTWNAWGLSQKENLLNVPIVLLLISDPLVSEKLSAPFIKKMWLGSFTSSNGHLTHACTYQWLIFRYKMNILRIISSPMHPGEAWQPVLLCLPSELTMLFSITSILEISRYCS